MYNIMMFMLCFVLCLQYDCMYMHVMFCILNIMNCSVVQSTVSILDTTITLILQCCDNLV